MHRGGKDGGQEDWGKGWRAGGWGERMEGWRSGGKEGGRGNDPRPSANGVALEAWDEKETKQKKMGIGRSVTYPRSKSTNSVALAAWDEE